MKARLLDPQATLYTQPDPASPPFAELSEGQELEIAGNTVSGGQRWATVVLPDSRRGYLPGGTRIQRLREVRLLQAAEAHIEPSAASPMLERYSWGTTLLVLGGVAEDGHTWIHVRDPHGKEGFISEHTSMEDAGQPSRAAVAAAAGRRNMLVGGLWCAGGTAVTVGTYASASGGGTYVVAWGAIIFGGFQFLKGLFQFLDTRS